MTTGGQEAGRPPAVVIGLGSVTGLQTARVLAARGIEVVGIAGDRSHFAARTRACHEVHEADIHGGGFVDLLDRLRPRFPEGAVLFPCTDQSVLHVSEHRERLGPTYLTRLPEHEVLATLACKAGFATFTREHDLATPRTQVLEDRADAERAADQLTFPVLLKPALKTALWKQQTTEKLRSVGSRDELLSAYDTLAPWSGRMVAQEVVPGGDDLLYTCNAYFDESHEPLVTFVTRKVRQWPLGTGTASLAEEVRNDEVVRLTTELFRAAKFTGLGYLELKHEPATGRYLLIEANVGRPTGRSATAEAAGVELLATMYADVLGRPLPDAREQGEGHARWIDVRRDTLAAIQQARAGDLGVGEWWRSVRGPKAHAVLSARDPLPFVLEVTQSARKAVRRLAS